MFIRKKKYEELENNLAEEQIKVLLLSSRLAILEKKFEDILEENTKLKKEIDNEENKKRKRKSKKRAFKK
jgi:hypothetical protein